MSKAETSIFFLKKKIAKVQNDECVIFLHKLNRWAYINLEIKIFMYNAMNRQGLFKHARTFYVNEII